MMLRVKGTGTVIMVVLVTLAAVAMVLIGVLPAFSQEGDGVQANAPEAAVAEAITYQGRLTDNNGNPLNGDHDMRFFLYDADAGGSALFDSGEQTVSVADGLFTVALPVPQETFNGQALWLSIQVEGQTLSPRQPLTPAPYAMSLRPGALVERDTAGDGLTVQNVATGAAVHAESTDVALSAEGANFAVYGLNTGGPEGAGYGGYFESTTGTGVFGSSSAAPSVDNTVVPGVHGHSEHGAGVYGTTDSSFAYGVYGEQENEGIGVFGQAATGFGVVAISDGDGVRGIGEAHGVYGSNSAAEDGFGYGGYFESTTGTGVFGSTTAGRATNNSLPAGVYGYSENGAGVYGEAGDDFARAGHFEGDVVVDGDLIVSGNKSGYVVDIALNDGDEPLSQGDVVVVNGITDPVLGDIPVPLVRKADGEASTAVIGVVDKVYAPDEEGRGRMVDGPAQPGDYVGIVTLGVFSDIKVDATYGAIEPGDLLVSSPTPGHAMAAGATAGDGPHTGAIIGKALSALEDGSGTVAVMVTLH